MINPVILINKKIPSIELSYGQRVKPKNVKVDVESGVVSGEFGNNIKTKINMKDGSYECNCEYSERTYCRHVVALLLNFDVDKYPELASEFEKSNPPWLKNKDVPTGVSSIDKLMKGGFKRGKITLLTGSSKSGKTTLMLQTAVNLAVTTGLKTLYIDTENMFSEGDDILYDFYNMMSSRYDINPDTFQYIDVVKGTDYNDIRRLINVGFDIQSTGRKVQVSVNKWAFSTSLLYRQLKSGAYGLVVLDSFSALVKNMSALSNTANLPARANIMEAIWYRFEEIAKDLNIAVVFISHESYDRIRIKIKDVVSSKVAADTFYSWGGQSLLYLVKYMYFLTFVPEDQFPFVKNLKYKDEMRILSRRLYPYAEKPEYIYVRNKYGRGFIDWNEI